MGVTSHVPIAASPFGKPNGKTRIMVEVITDPKGSLPAWLINLIQKDWPYNTISALKKRAKKGDIKPNPKMAGWHTK